MRSELIFGPFALILGSKKFRESGMPFSRTRTIVGAPAKVLNSLSGALGLLMTAGGVVSLLRFIGRLVELSAVEQQTAMRRTRRERTFGLDGSAL